MWKGSLHFVQSMYIGFSGWFWELLRTYLDISSVAADPPSGKISSIHNHLHNTQAKFFSKSHSCYSLIGFIPKNPLHFEVPQ